MKVQAGANYLLVNGQFVDVASLDFFKVEYSIHHTLDCEP